MRASLVASKEALSVAALAFTSRSAACMASIFPASCIHRRNDGRRSQISWAHDARAKRGEHPCISRGPEPPHLLRESGAGREGRRALPVQRDAALVQLSLGSRRERDRAQASEGKTRTRSSRRARSGCPLVAVRARHDLLLRDGQGCCRRGPDAGLLRPQARPAGRWKDDLVAARFDGARSRGRSKRISRREGQASAAARRTWRAAWRRSRGPARAAPPGA